MKKTGCDLKKLEDASVNSDRRNMLKKAVYTAPTLVALGLLTRSPATSADSRVPGPPGWPPGGWPP